MSENKFKIGDLVRHRASGRLGVVAGYCKDNEDRWKYDIEVDYDEIQFDIIEFVLSAVPPSRFGVERIKDGDWSKFAFPGDNPDDLRVYTSTP